MSSKRDASTAGGDKDGTAAENSEGGTNALQRKRSRRVSFAENTSVHFFDRDEEYNEAQAVAEEAAAAQNVANERDELKVLLELHASEDAKCVDEDDRKSADDDTDNDDVDFSCLPSFLKPVGSPSPGSTIGSATSHDEDNYFGPVCASFIRPGRLSDSAASDDNHEVTLDSTSFSMHFRSLARSDSGADSRTPTGVSLSSIAKSDLGDDLKTPARVHLAFEQKSPTNDTVGSSMDLTMLKKPNSNSSSGNVNCYSGSSDMSLIVDTPSKYKYGRLPPEMEALLAENVISPPIVSASLTRVASPSPRGMENKYVMLEVNERLMSIMDNGNETSFHKKLGKEKNGSALSPKNGLLYATADALPSENLIDNSNSLPGPSPRVKTSLPLGMQSTAENIQSESPMELISSSTVKGKQALSSIDSQVKLTCTATSEVNCSPGKGRRTPEKGSPGMYKCVVTPQDKTVSSFLNMNVMHEESAPSIQRSLLKLKSLAASPFSSSLTVKLDIADNNALDISKPSPISTFLLEEGNSFHNEYLVRPVCDSEGQLLSDPKDNQELVFPSLLDSDLAKDPLGGGHTVVKVKDGHLRPKSPIATNVVPAATDSLSLEVVREHVKEKKAFTTPHKLSSLDVLKAKKAFPEDNGLFLDNSLLRSRLKNLQALIGHDSGSKGRAFNASISTEDVDEPGYLSLENSLQPGERVLNSSNQTDRNLAVDLSSRQNIEISRTPTGKVNDYIQSGIGNSMFEKDHPGGESEAAASAHRNMKEVNLRKNLLYSFTGSPSKNDSPVISRKILGVSEVEKVSSLVLNKINSPGKKKQAVEGNRNKAGACSRSPKIQKIRDNDVAGHHNKDDQGAPIVGHELKHWTDIYPKFLKEADNMFGSSIDKLNLSSIESLEGYLACLQRFKAYGNISNRIIDQKRASGDVLHYERVCEAKNLLHKIILEKGKLQLVNAKKQKILEKVQKLKIGIEESQKLKIDSLSKSMEHGEGYIAANQNSVQSKNMADVTGDKIMTMKQTLEALDRKSSNLLNTLTTAHKIKVEPSCDIIESANDHLINKLSCHDILSKSKVWVFNEIKSREGHYNIVLNYLGFINQRFNVTFAPASDMIISNRWDEKIISQNFPRLEACTAFSFVLNSETSRKYISSRSLAQETQATSAVLGNLVDVLKEIQQAKIELQNMTRAAFHSPSGAVTQLDLHICFFNFKNVKKTTFTLDLSCLKRGIYPSEIIPSKIATGNASNDSSVEPIMGEIMEAVRGLRTGYLRILRLCRLVSQVVQTSNAYL